MFGNRVAVLRLYKSGIYGKWGDIGVIRCCKCLIVYGLSIGSQRCDCRRAVESRFCDCNVLACKKMP